MKIFSLLLLALALGCGSGSIPVANRAGLWKIRYSLNVPSTLSPTPGALGFFDFPPSTGFVGYVVSSYVGPKPTAIKMSYGITGDGIFNADWNQLNGPAQGCTNPPTVTVMVQIANDNLEDEDGRWWSSPQVLANDGDVTVDVPTDPKLWSNVEGHFGSSRVSQFNSAMSNLGHVGFTFGGGCNYGHGVDLSSGASKFTLISYSVN